MDAPEIATAKCTARFDIATCRAMYDNAAGRYPTLDLLTLLVRLRAAGTVERPAPV